MADDQRQRMAEFRASTVGRMVALQFVPFSAFDAMFQAATDGDKMAERCSKAFVAWDNAVEASGHPPLCFCCGTVVHQHSGELGGVAYVYAAEGKPEDHYAMVTIACSTCAKKDPAVLCEILKQQLCVDLNVEVAAVH